MDAWIIFAGILLASWCIYTSIDELRKAVVVLKDTIVSVGLNIRDKK